MPIERATTPDIPDHTAASQRGGTNGSVEGVTAADLRRGYTRPDSEPVSPFASDASGIGAEEQVGDAYTQGGFLRRQRGFSR